jgi:hypothetical protein
MRSQKIPIGQICVNSRDDIQLRTYVLLTRDRKTWINFVKGANEFNIRPRQYEEFLDLYQNIRVDGIKEPIRIQKIGDMYYVEDGAHRLSIARALGHSTIEAYVVSDCGMPSVFLASLRSTTIPIDRNNPRILKIFKYISQDKIKKFINLKIETDTKPIPMSAAAILWPTCEQLWPDIIEDIKIFHDIESIKILVPNSEAHVKQLTIDLYRSDDVALWKVKAKFPYFLESSSPKFCSIFFTIKDARHRIKNKTGNEISMAIEDLKSHIRKKYRPLVKNYPTSGQPDLLIHAGDNEYQTKEIKSTINYFFRE